MSAASARAHAAASSTPPRKAEDVGVLCWFGPTDNDSVSGRAGRDWVEGLRRDGWTVETVDPHRSASDRSLVGQMCLRDVSPSFRVTNRAALCIFDLRVDPGRHAWLGTLVQRVPGVGLLDDTEPDRWWAAWLQASPGGDRMARDGSALHYLSAARLIAAVVPPGAPVGFTRPTTLERLVATGPVRPAGPATGSRRDEVVVLARGRGPTVGAALGRTPAGARTPTVRLIVDPAEHGATADAVGRALRGPHVTVVGCHVDLTPPDVAEHATILVQADDATPGIRRRILAEARQRGALTVSTDDLAAADRVGDPAVLRLASTATLNADLGRLLVAGDDLARTGWRQEGGGDGEVAADQGSEAVGDLARRATWLLTEEAQRVVANQVIAVAPHVAATPRGRDLISRSLQSGGYRAHDQARPRRPAMVVTRAALRPAVRTALHGIGLADDAGTGPEGFCARLEHLRPGQMAIGSSGWSPEIAAALTASDARVLLVVGDPRRELLGGDPTDLAEWSELGAWHNLLGWHSHPSTLVVRLEDLEDQSDPSTAVRIDHHLRFSTPVSSRLASGPPRPAATAVAALDRGTLDYAETHLGHVLDAVGYERLVPEDPPTRTRPDEAAVRVILAGQRRSGTTFAFRWFRVVPDLTCFYEPLHSHAFPDLGRRAACAVERDEKAVFAELARIRRDATRHWAPLGDPLRPVDEEIDPAAWTPAHTAWCRWLLDRSDRSLIQPVRANHHLPRLVDQLPDARVVWVVRDPAAVVWSQAGNPEDLLDRSELDDRWRQIEAARWLIEQRPDLADLHDAPPWMQLLALWVDHQDALEATRAAAPDRVRVLRYEDLVADPDATMGELTQWLGLDPPDSALGPTTELPVGPSFVDDARWLQGLARFGQGNRRANRGQGRRHLLD